MKPKGTTNFIVFRLGDNDFHFYLQKAIKHIAAGQTEELTPDALKYFVVTGTNAFSNIGRIDNFAFVHRQGRDSTEYLNKAISIEYVDQVPEQDGREGYIWNRHTDEVYYFGY